MQNDIIFFVDVIRYGVAGLILLLVVLNTVSGINKLKDIKKIFKDENKKRICK